MVKIGNPLHGADIPKRLTYYNNMYKKYNKYFDYKYEAMEKVKDLEKGNHILLKKWYSPFGVKWIIYYKMRK